MSLPTPVPGMVLSYEFLWSDEHARGQETGLKARPAVVVTAVRRHADGALLVSVLPITHSPPSDRLASVELGPELKRLLSLDDAASWAIADEINDFIWPGYDLAPGPDGRWVYGSVPPGFFAQLRRALARAAALKRLRRVIR